MTIAPPTISSARDKPRCIGIIRSGCNCIDRFLAGSAPDDGLMAIRANFGRGVHPRVQNELSTSPARSLLLARVVRSTIQVRPYRQAEDCRIQVAEKSW